MSRADKFTAQYKKPIYYVDFLDSFEVTPLTGSLATVTNEDSVGQSIRNLVLTGIYERYEQPLIGSKIRALLFEPYTPIVHQQLVNEITSTIDNYEPRAKVVVVEVNELEDQNAIGVQIVYTLINIPEQKVINIVLKRIR